MFGFYILGAVFLFYSFFMVSILMPILLSLGLWGFFFVVFSKEIQQDASNEEIINEIKNVR